MIHPSLQVWCSNNRNKWFGKTHGDRNTAQHQMAEKKLMNARGLERFTVTEVKRGKEACAARTGILPVAPQVTRLTLTLIAGHNSVAEAPYCRLKSVIHVGRTKDQRNMPNPRSIWFSYL